MLPLPLPTLWGLAAATAADDDGREEDDDNGDEEGSSSASTLRQEAIAPERRSPALDTRGFGSAEPATASATSLGAAARGGGGNEEEEEEEKLGLPRPRDGGERLLFENRRESARPSRAASRDLQSSERAALAATARRRSAAEEHGGGLARTGAVCPVSGETDGAEADPARVRGA